MKQTGRSSINYLLLNILLGDKVGIEACINQTQPEFINNQSHFDPVAVSNSQWIAQEFNINAECDF